MKRRSNVDIGSGRGLGGGLAGDVGLVVAELIKFTPFIVAFGWEGHRDYVALRDN